MFKAMKPLSGGEKLFFTGLIARHTQFITRHFCGNKNLPPCRQDVWHVKHCARQN